MHPNIYPTDATWVRIIRTLLTWFAPLLEKNSPLLEDFDGFFKEVEASIGNSVRTTNNKINRLRQGAYISSKELPTT